MGSDSGRFPVQAWSTVGNGNLNMWKQQQEKFGRPRPGEVSEMGHVGPQRIPKKHQKDLKDPAH